MIKKIIESLGRSFLQRIESLGLFWIFFVSGILKIFISPFQFSKILDHVWFIGAKSVLVILLTGLFTGMVLGLQGYYSLVDYGSEAALGSAVALTLVRELGPVLTAIMIAARAGSSMAAEIGSMRISEQIDALKTMQISPVRFIFSPRLIASVISFPLLTSIFNIIGIFGGYLTGSVMLGINKTLYLEGAINIVFMRDITGGFIKSFIFALVVTGICCFQGYYTHFGKGGEVGAKGLAISTTNAVVQSCVYILVCDYIITFFQV